MGVVYRAKDERLGRHVALKLLPEELHGDRQALERLKREARAASSLNHPNICTIYDVGETDGQYFIAMELLEGETLQRHIAGRPLANAEILEIGLQLAAALDAAHSKGIVHRDIKPSNVIVDHNGQAKLLDFGLASVEQLRVGAATGATDTAVAPEGLTSPGAALGTAAYMAPEQARGEELDARCDLFSFGAVLYEMCSGRPAFGGATLALIFDRILHKQPAALQQVNPGLLPGLEAVVMKALAKDREERYQSAADLRADLRRLRRESESGQTAVSAKPIVAWWRHPWPYAGLVLAIAAIAGGVYLYSTRKLSAPIAKQADWAPITDFADSAVSPAISSDGHMLAFIRGDNTFFGNGQIYIKLLPDGEPVQLTRDGLAKLSPEFSPDGSRIAYTAVPVTWDTWVVPVLGGEPRLMLANAEGLTWIDAKNLLFSELRKGLHMVLVTAGENRENSRDVYVPPRERGMAHRSAISPDHKWVLLSEMDNGGWLPCRLVPFDGSSTGRNVGPASGGCTYVAWSPDGAWMYFSSNAGGRFHIWRQSFPDGVPQQLTSGATEEEGIAVAPDGRSLITSVGLVQSTIMLHDSKGERQLSSASYADSPQFSPDGKYIFYLVAPSGTSGSLSGPLFESGELFRVSLETGENDHLLPGFLMGGYGLSPDGKQVVFSAVDPKGHARLWIADLDLRSSPRQFPSTVNEDDPAFDRNGNIYFRAAEGGSNFLYRMKEDGSDRVKVFPYSIILFDSISPDGRWAVVAQALSSDGNGPFVSLTAAPLSGATPVIFCHEHCDAMWSNQGKSFVVHLYVMGGGKTLFVPVASGDGAPLLPPLGVDSKPHPETVKGARVVDNVIIPGPNPGQYAYLSRSVHRNLYRIPLS